MTSDKINRFGVWLVQNGHGYDLFEYGMPLYVNDIAGEHPIYKSRMKEKLEYLLDLPIKEDEKLDKIITFY